MAVFHADHILPLYRKTDCLKEKHMESKTGILSSKFFPIVVFLIFELILFVLRFMYVIDHNLYKTLSFTVAFSILCLLEAWQAYRKNHMTEAKASLVFAILFMILSFL